MKTALDTSVILDVLTADAEWAEASEASLKKAFALGPLVIGECVLAELTPALVPGDLDQFLADWKILFLPSTRESARMAGEMYRGYLLRSPKKGRVLPDFLIGSHALHHTGRLLARDRGYYRDYFSGLTLIEPRK
jgi:predicted nucleic acid-binding protein